MAGHQSLDNQSSEIQSSEIQALREQLAACMGQDRYRFKRELDRLSRSAAEHASPGDTVTKIQQKIEHSCQLA